jgi:hypothetical protein
MRQKEQVDEVIPVFTSAISQSYDALACNIHILAIPQFPYYKREREKKRYYLLKIYIQKMQHILSTFPRIRYIRL